MNRTLKFFSNNSKRLQLVDNKAKPSCRKKATTIAVLCTMASSSTAMADVLYVDGTFNIPTNTTIMPQEDFGEGGGIDLQG